MNGPRRICNYGLRSRMRRQVIDLRDKLRSSSPYYAPNAQLPVTRSRSAFPEEMQDGGSAHASHTPRSITEWTGRRSFVV